MKRKKAPKHSILHDMLPSTPWLLLMVLMLEMTVLLFLSMPVPVDGVRQSIVSDSSMESSLTADALPVTAPSEDEYTQEINALQEEVVDVFPAPEEHIDSLAPSQFEQFAEAVQSVYSSLVESVVPIEQQNTHFQLVLAYYHLQKAAELMTDGTTTEALIEEAQGRDRLRTLAADHSWVHSY